MDGVIITPGDLCAPEVIALLQTHLDQMHAQSPPESVHALDLEGLKGDDISFWTIWQDESVVGCGALKTLSSTHGEIKSMHILADQRGKGLAARVLEHILDEARNKGMERLSLETGAPDDFKAARLLYEKYGFQTCGPFADFKLDPFSLFMTREI